MTGAAADVGRLEESLSRPAEADVALMARLDGDILVLGVAGKMGPTLALLVRRASDMAGKRRRVIGVSRFTDPGVRRTLDKRGIQTVAADLLDRATIEALPDAPHVIFMAGQKFGTSDKPSRTWAVNAHMPTLVAERFAASRIVAFSSGNVYPLSDTNGQGPEEAGPVGPIGEYAQSVLARERLLEHFSERNGTPVAIMRLNYAVEPRYGVLRDIADRVRDRRPVSLAMGYVNVIWQRDANSIALHLLERCAVPPFVLNVTGTRKLRVRRLAERFGELFGVAPTFRGREQPTALLSDASLCHSLYGSSTVDVDGMVDRVARWVRAGGKGLGKPTHFEERGGRF